MRDKFFDGLVEINKENQGFLGNEEIFGDEYGRGAGYSIRKFREPSTFFIGKYGVKRGFLGKNGQLKEIGGLFFKGCSFRSIAKIVGCSKNTVKRFCKALSMETGKKSFCSCGLPNTHQGWCSVRYKESPRRQEFMKRLHASPGGVWESRPGGGKKNKGGQNVLPARKKEIQKANKIY